MDRPEDRRVSSDEASALARYYSAESQIEDSQAQVTAAAIAKAKALNDLHELGWSYQRIGTEIGLTRARVQQLVERGRTA